MSIPAIILLVFIAIVSVLLVLIVLLQNEEGDGLGGLFGGGSNSAFGARSGNVLTRITSVLAILFFGLIALFAYVQVPRAEKVNTILDTSTYVEMEAKVNSSDKDEELIVDEELTIETAIDESVTE